MKEITADNAPTPFKVWMTGTGQIENVGQVTSNGVKVTKQYFPKRLKLRIAEKTYEFDEKEIAMIEDAIKTGAIHEQH